jgi:hypothetical protein
MIKSSRSSLSDTEQLANLTRNIESGGDPALLQNRYAKAITAGLPTDLDLI